MGDDRVRWWVAKCVATAVLVLSAALVCQSAVPPRRVCRRVAIEGEVRAGQEWRAGLGEGWVFRITPISGVNRAYSGWDLVVDREPPAGYPDALLLATLPYRSLNEREIGTTFGLRAQDAIGWNPRSFRFLSDPQQFREAQRLFLQRMRSGPARGASGSSSTSAEARDVTRLLAFEKGATSGELRILDARIVPGIADPKAYASAWAMAGSRTPHEIEQAAAGQQSEQGKLVWMRFALTLWLPRNWRLAEGLHALSTPCPD